MVPSEPHTNRGWCVGFDCVWRSVVILETKKPTFISNINLARHVDGRFSYYFNLHVDAALIITGPFSLFRFCIGIFVIGNSNFGISANRRVVR